jgi:hypothetical protein
MAYTPLRRPKHDPDATRRALEILADAGVEGHSEAVLLARGFTIDQLVNLVSAGLATATPQPVVVGDNRYEIPTLRITDNGKRALLGRQGTHPPPADPPLADPGPYISPDERLAVSATRLPARSAPSAKIERDAIRGLRPDLKGKTDEAVRRILRREARLSLKPHRAARDRDGDLER